MEFLDIFSGIGGFRLGLEMAGHKCIGHCEIDKYANTAYTAMHNVKGDEWFEGDIQRIRKDEIPKADLWCFGFPCQDISVAGKQKGISGARSGLFFKVIDLIKSKEEEDKPKILLIENVKNLLSINGGWDFATILSELDEAGYDAEWQIINSSWWVPQNRERIFIVGHLRGRSRPKIFPISRSNSKNIEKLIDGKQGYRVYSTKGISCTLLGEAGGYGGKTGLYLFQRGIKVSRKNRPQYTDKSNCIMARDYKGIGNQEMTAVEVRPILTPDRLMKRQNGRRFKNNGESMFTLTAQDRHGVMIREATKKGYADAYEGDSINLTFPDSQTRRGRVGHGIAQTLDTQCNQGILSSEYRIRRLTPKECFRLQGFPDEYFNRAKSAGLSDTRLYKCAGNSVTVDVIHEIGKLLN